MEGDWKGDGGGNGDTDAERKALAKLARVISDRDGRANFRSDPSGALGEDWERLPGGVRDALSDIGERELDALARLHDALVEAGHVVDVDGGKVGIF
jgi:hypothetical protein